MEGDLTELILNSSSLAPAVKDMCRTQHTKYVDNIEASGKALTS